jgi:hypothetical protein
MVGIGAQLGHFGCGIGAVGDAGLIGGLGRGGAEIAQLGLGLFGQQPGVAGGCTLLAKARFQVADGPVVPRSDLPAVPP